MSLCSDEDFEAEGLYCPACGKAMLVLRGRKLVCEHQGCPRPDAAAKVLSDPEIHHIVKFDGYGNYFAAKHPLRERIDGELLDCAIHDEVTRWRDDGNPTDGTWRVKRRDDVDGEEYNEWPYLWEKIE